MGDAPRHNGTHFSSHFADFQAGDKPQQIVGVGADIAHHQRWATAHRVFFPGAAARAGFSPAPLYIFHLNQSDFPQLAVHHHRLGLAHHGVAGVIVGQAEHQASLQHALL